jgi:hypothetical protein
LFARQRVHGLRGPAAFFVTSHEIRIRLQGIIEGASGGTLAPSVNEGHEPILRLSFQFVSSLTHSRVGWWFLQFPSPMAGWFVGFCSIQTFAAAVIALTIPKGR